MLTATNSTDHIGGLIALLLIEFPVLLVKVINGKINHFSGLTTPLQVPFAAVATKLVLGKDGINVVSVRWASRRSCHRCRRGFHLSFFYVFFLWLNHDGLVGGSLLRICVRFNRIGITLNTRKKYRQRLFRSCIAF